MAMVLHGPQKERVIVCAGTRMLSPNSIEQNQILAEVSSGLTQRGFHE